MNSSTGAGFSIEYQVGWGATMMDVRGPWSERFTQAWFDHGGRSGGLGITYKARGGDLQFLRDLVGLRLLAVDGIASDDSAIGQCVTLERLVLQSGATNSIDWSGLHALRMVSMDPRSGMHTLAMLPRLERLEIWTCEDRDFAMLGTFRALEDLALKPSRRLRSLDGIEGLDKLAALEINYAAAKLDLRILGSLPRLRTLRLGGCRKQIDLVGLESCERLSEVYLGSCGNIATLTNISGLRHLSKVYLGGDTRVLDGHVSFLGDMPSIQYVDFTDRRHYDARSESFPKIEAVHDR